MATVIPYIPQQITVHLGPPNSDAENVTVSFVDYVNKHGIQRYTSAMTSYHIRKSQRKR